MKSRRFDKIKKPETSINLIFCFSVLFDSEFSGGLSIRSNSNRSYRLPGSALINLTHGRDRSQQPGGGQHQHQQGHHQHQQGQYQGQQGGRYVNAKPVARVKPMGTPPRSVAPRRQQSVEGNNFTSNSKQSNSAAKAEAGFCPSVAPPDPKMLPNPVGLFGAKNVQSHAQTPPQPTQEFVQVKAGIKLLLF